MPRKPEPNTATDNLCATLAIMPYREMMDVADMLLAAIGARNDPDADLTARDIADALAGLPECVAAEDDSED